MAETRVERVKRADSPAAPQPVETVDRKATPAPPPSAEPVAPGRQFEEQREPSRPEYVFERSSRRALAFEREEFGRSREFSPIDRED